jgi:hypothetical protein
MKSFYCRLYYVRGTCTFTSTTSGTKVGSHLTPLITFAYWWSVELLFKAQNRVCKFFFLLMLPGIYPCTSCTCNLFLVFPRDSLLSTEYTVCSSSLLRRKPETLSAYKYARQSWSCCFWREFVESLCIFSEHAFALHSYWILFKSYVWIDLMIYYETGGWNFLVALRR